MIITKREWRITQNSVSAAYRIEDRRQWFGRWWGSWRWTEPGMYGSSARTYKTAIEAQASLRDIQTQIAYHDSVWQVTGLCR